MTQHITWTIDTNAPVFTSVPANQDLLCNPPVLPTSASIAGLVTVIDDCSTPLVTVSCQDSPLAGCSTMRTFTIIASDNCGNVATTNVIYTWKTDTQPPSITCLPDMVVTNPNPAISVTGIPIVVDNCDTNPTVTNVDSSTPGDCSGSLIIYRTWSAIDSCGNSNGCTVRN